MELNVAEHAVSELDSTTCLIALGWLERDIDPENSMLCQCLISFQLRHSPPRFYMFLGHWSTCGGHGLSRFLQSRRPNTSDHRFQTAARFESRDRIGDMEKPCGKYDIENIGMEGQVYMEYSAEMIMSTKNVTCWSQNLTIRCLPTKGWPELSEV